MPNPSRAEMLSKIYEVIADKTLSFGCKVKRVHINTIIEQSGRDWIVYDEEDKKQRIYDNVYIKDSYRVIGHPILIGDVLDWIQQKNTEPFQLFGGYSVGDINLNLWHLRLSKRKPIDDQSDECISFIYNILPHVNQD